MTQKNVFLFPMMLLALSALSGCTGTQKEATTQAPMTHTASVTDPLQFPVYDYTERIVRVTSSSGEKEVTYRLYQHITYVKNPVDADYQSMNVKVPIKIDDKDIDAANSPILFVISVGGYLSSKNLSDGMGGPPDDSMGGPPGGGMGGPPGGGFGGPSTGRMGGPPGGGMGEPPSGGGRGGPPGDRKDGPPTGEMDGPPGGDRGMTRNSDLALAMGYVVVEPGCRGRDNQAEDGSYYGKAPAAIVDLKAAVRYIRHNDDLIAGNANWIISTGSSAGGALSALLGASGDSGLYDAYFEELGAANESDRIYASADFCPITDLEHADMAYEWMYGSTPIKGNLVDQDLSQQLKNAFVEYQAFLKLEGQNGFGLLTADNYAEYLVQTYLIPSANKFLLALKDQKRQAYLAENRWIAWSENSAAFTFEDYVEHVGRMKNLPAFDAFDLSSAETILFGDATTNARHFTNFSLRESSGDQNAELDDELKTVVNLMNPMYFISQAYSGCADYWWIRHGASDNDTALPVITNLATSLENSGKSVNALLYWDAGHGADEDPEDFIAWIAQITGYPK